MDGGTQVMKVPASKPLSNVDINERGHHMDGTQMDPQSPGRDIHGTQRLPNLHFDGGLVSPTKAVDTVTSPLPSVGARDYRDLRIGLPRITDSASRSSEDDRRRRMPTRPRSFMPTPRTMDNDDLVKNFNPDPVPFHSQVFKDPLRKVRVCGNSVSASDDGTLSQGSSFYPNNNMSSHNRSSTMVKKFPPQSRNTAMWGANSDPENVNKPRGYIVHTDRYKWDEVYTTPDEFTQRGRLQLEMNYVNRLRSIRRRRDITPHRETVEFVMGGEKAELNERDDVMQELKNLKGLILPTAAKDLYVGKGISKTLPKDHALNKPRHSLTYSQRAKKSPGPGPAGTSRSDGGKTETLTTDGQSRSDTVPNDVPTDHSGTKPQEDLVLQQPTELTDSIPQSAPGASQHTDPEFTTHNEDSSHVVENSMIVEVQETLLADSLTVSSLAPEIVTALEEIHGRCSSSNEGQMSIMNEWKSRLSVELSSSQDIYIGQIFELATNRDMLTLDEFKAFHCLCTKISSLKERPKEAFDKIDMNKLRHMILKFTAMFHPEDKDKSGKIRISSLKPLVQMVLPADADIDDILQGLNNDPEWITKTDFMANIPYFISLMKE